MKKIFKLVRLKKVEDCEDVDFVTGKVTENVGKRYKAVYQEKGKDEFDDPMLFVIHLFVPKGQKLITLEEMEIEYKTVKTSHEITNTDQVKVNRK